MTGSRKLGFFDRNVLLRIVKPYPDARNHIYTGRVVEYDGAMIAIDCCVLHFARATPEDPTGGLTVSRRAVRWIPLQRVEYVRQLPEGMDPYDLDHLRVSEGGNISYSILNRPDLMPT